MSTIDHDKLLDSSMVAHLLQPTTGRQLLGGWVGQEVARGGPGVTPS